MKSDFTFCPHCAVKGKQRQLLPAAPRTPHVARSDARNFHLFLEELVISRPAGAGSPQVAALFRYDLDSAAKKSESSLVTIKPAGETQDLVLSQLQRSADRLAAILEKGTDLQRMYSFAFE